MKLKYFYKMVITWRSSVRWFAIFIKKIVKIKFKVKLKIKIKSEKNGKLVKHSKNENGSLITAKKKSYLSLVFLMKMRRWIFTSTSILRNIFHVRWRRVSFWNVGNFMNMETDFNQIKYILWAPTCYADQDPDSLTDVYESFWPNLAVVLQNSKYIPKTFYIRNCFHFEV